MAKLPHPPPPAVLLASEPEIVAVAPHTVLWRIHDTVGPYVTGWNSLRHFGPVARARFDPHEPPPHLQDAGVYYTALDVPTALAEVFQLTRVVDVRRRSPHLTGMQLTRTLNVLDLSGAWPVRAGASHAIGSGRRDVSRAWARAIVAAWPELDGLWHLSSMTGKPCLTVFNPGADALPDTPVFSEPLDHPGLRPWLAAGCKLIGYRLL